MAMKNRFVTLLVLAATILLTACAQPESAATPPVAAPTATQVAVVAVEELVVEGDGESAESEPTPAPATPEPTATTDVQSVTEPTPTLAPVVEPIEVTYFTPAQQEGPYYTVDKPADRDNDLVELAGATGVPAGTILEFGGTVYDATGMPLEGLVIEIWQTDDSGAYLHPRDPATDNRDRNFQFYGEATTDAAGRYDFRTIVPGEYEPRPVHIHVKIKADGAELLTTQFYFEGDPALLITVTDGVDANGNPILVGERDVILQQELPAYYPDGLQ